MCDFAGEIEMKLKCKYSEMVIYIYLIGLISFIFLRCQDISAQEVAAMSTIFIFPYFDKVFKSRGHYKRIVIVIIIYMTFEIIRSLIRYGQGIKPVLYLSGELFSLFLYFYFTSFTPEKSQKFISIILKIFCFELVALWIIALIYNFTKIRLLDEVVFRVLRNERVRIYYGAPMVVIGLILLFGKMIYRANSKLKNRKIDYIFLMLGSVYFIYVCQSRMLMIAITFSLFFMCGLSYKRFSKKIVIVGVCIFLLSILIFIPQIQRYILHNFGGILNGTDTALFPRFRGIRHFIEVVRDDKLFGKGFMNYSSPSNGIYNIQYILRGKWGNYYTNDVGIFGYYMMFGTVGIIIYMVLLLKIVKHGYKERFKNPHKIGIAVFLIISSVSITFFDLERQSYIALYLLCMDLNINHGNVNDKIDSALVN